MTTLPYSMSQVKRAIEGIDHSLNGKVAEHILTAQEIAQLQAIRMHLQAAHNA